MRRFASKYLKNWFDSKKSKPLILRGARQVGKSTLVRLFCEENQIDLIEINLEKFKLQSLIDSENFSVEKVIKEIELVAAKRVTPKSVIFFDEIQEIPIALNRLRYFYEDRNDLKVIAAGSLLEAVLEKERFSMPVGRIEYYRLGPMSFSEFLMAKGEDIILSQIKDLSVSTPPSNILHLKAIDLLKEYFYVGGMPEAVKEYVDSGDILKVREIHQDLYRTFMDDIPKYAQRVLGTRVAEVFEKLPLQLGEDKVKFSSLGSGNSTIIRQSIELLAKAGLIYKVIHTNCSGLPLKANSDDSAMKLFYLDIGLYNTVMGTSWSDLFYLSPQDLIIKGKMAEQFVAQHLMFSDPKNINLELFYWLRDKKKGAAEVDFIISKDSVIYPLEVKSGSTGKMRSLWQYVAQRKTPMAIRCDLKLRKKILTQVSHSIKTQEGISKIDCELLGIPLYAIEYVERFLK